MSTPENIVETNDNIEDTEDLDSFNSLFHGSETPKDSKDDDPASDDDTDDSDAPLEQEETQPNEDDDDLADEDEKDDASDNKEDKPKKTRAQERIEQLLEKERLARERADKLESKLQELQNKEPKESAPAPKVEQNSADTKAPHPDDKTEDGSDKYPLGQFDPSFQEDHVNYLIEKSLAEQRTALENQRREEDIRRAQDDLSNSWNTKLEPARERYPDFSEKGEQLLGTFSELDQQYGEYLTTTIMGMDHGPDVLYYLSSNVDEAKRIVGLGPLGATIALGRIEARFDDIDDGEEKPKPRPKTSKAPPPPPINRGSKAAVGEVADDTDDLEAFSAKLFKKR